MDGVELDVKLTSDGVPVLLHDYNLGRTTNVWTQHPGVKYNPSTTRVSIRPSPSPLGRRLVSFTS